MPHFLKKWQPYLLVMRGFLPEVGGFCLKVGRQVVAPGFGRKGNLLSTLFFLFTGLTERVIGLARELVLRAPGGVNGNFPGKDLIGKGWIFSRKYLRLAMLVFAWGLFILSSLEWVVVSGPGAMEVTVAERVEAAHGSERVETGAFPVKGLKTACVRSGYERFPVLDCPTIGGRRWLRLSVLRI